MSYRYAVVVNDKVRVIRDRLEPMGETPNNVLLAADEECEQGWGYDANATPRFIAPPSVNVWTAYQFLLRFTEAELLGIRTAAITDPITWRFLTLATAAQEINSADLTTIGGMDYLVSQNLLTAQRKAEILGA
jgi:hypothetical protein